MEDSVRAYGNLYEEIVQGYRNGTRERYTEDENSKTGFRKMTMEEELSGLDRAFQKMANEVDGMEKGPYLTVRSISAVRRNARTENNPYTLFRRGA